LVSTREKREWGRRGGGISNKTKAAPVRGVPTAARGGAILNDERQVRKLRHKNGAPEKEGCQTRGKRHGGRPSTKQDKEGKKEGTPLDSLGRGRGKQIKRIKASLLNPYGWEKERQLNDNARKKPRGSPSESGRFRRKKEHNRPSLIDRKGEGE